MISKGFEQVAELMGRNEEDSMMMLTPLNLDSRRPNRTKRSAEALESAEQVSTELVAADAAKDTAAAAASIADASANEAVTAAAVAANAATPTAKKPKKEKDPNAPKRFSAYQRFIHTTRSALQSENPSLTPQDAMRLCAQKWNGLSGEERAVYEEMARVANLQEIEKAAESRRASELATESRSASEPTGSQADAPASAPTPTTPSADEQASKKKHKQKHKHKKGDEADALLLLPQASTAAVSTLPVDSATAVSTLPADLAAAAVPSSSPTKKEKKHKQKAND